MEKQRAICISAGERGRYWVRWARAAGLDVAGLVDTDRAKLDEVADSLGIPPEARFESIARAAEITGATVAVACTPNPVHAAVVEETLKAGCNTLIEKPMADRMEDARRVVALAKEKDLALAVAQQWRFTPLVIAMRDAVQSGSIGRPALVSLQFLHNKPSKGLALPLLLNQAVGLHRPEAQDRRRHRGSNRRPLPEASREPHH